MCTISWKEFLKNAQDFVELSTAYNDDWNLIEKDTDEGNAYLVFRQKINVPIENTDDMNDLTEFDSEDPADCSTATKTIEEEIFEMEYHVVYSISYQVPVLYFRGYRHDGKPIGLEEAWKIFQSPTGDSKVRTDMLSTLTQSDHPVMFTPFLGLHPCRTADLLAQMGQSRNVIVTFLSIMGPYVRLNLKNEYGLDGLK